MDEECSMYDEIFDLIQENCEENGEQVVKMTQLLVKDIKSNPNSFISNLEERLKLFCKQHNVCPKCGKELEVDTYNERSEYQGFPASEKISESYCPEHGDID